MKTLLLTMLIAVPCFSQLGARGSETIQAGGSTTTCATVRGVWVCPQGSGTIQNTPVIGLSELVDVPATTRKVLDHDIPTCSDKTRILLHDEQEPPKYWCHRVERERQ